MFAAVLPHAVLDEAIRYAQKIRISTITFNDPCCPSQAQLRFGVVSCRNGSVNGRRAHPAKRCGAFWAKSLSGKRLRKATCTTSRNRVCR